VTCAPVRASCTRSTGWLLVRPFYDPSVAKLIMPGENRTFLGGEDYLKQKGIEVVVLQNKECIELMNKFIREKPNDWNEDIGEQDG
jgi:hypothetical protein